MDKRIWLSSPHMGGAEEKYVKEAFDTNWIAPLGPNVNAVEENLGAYLGGTHVGALNTGTAGVHLALIQVGVKQGDVVLCSSFTFAASCNPIKYLCAEAVFVDSEPETWNMCPERLEEAIISLKQDAVLPKAIVVVHLYGMPSKMDEIMAVARKYDIPVVEDAAEALGSSYKGEMMGTIGDYGVFSFNGNKIITGSCGGAIVSANEENIKHSRFLSTQAKEPYPHFEHEEIGYNYRMSNICAGIVRGQLEVLDERVDRRREIHSKYDAELSKIDGISVLKEKTDDYFSNHWLTCILVEAEAVGVSREDIRLFLEEHNVESRPLWKPMHLQPVYKDARMFGGSVCEGFFEKGLCLPSGSNMTDEEVEKVIKLIKEYINK